MLIQFITAFNDIVIGRFNNERTELEKIKVRYIHAPKERVLFDIVNKAQNITLPVVSINVTGLTRDETRVFNKNEGFYIRNESLSGSSSVRMPVPMNVGISMSIMTSYQSDMDQIISNFVPYTNPYVIISWKIPEAFKLSNIKEIRSEVLWDGNISVEYPTDVGAGDKPRFIATTTFTIKGWLFPEAPKDLIKNIYFIDGNFHSVNKLEDLYTTNTSELSGNTEIVSISGIPQITNGFLIQHGTKTDLISEYAITPKNQNSKILIIGKNLTYTTNIFLSSNGATASLPISSQSFTYYPTISGYLIPQDNYTIIDSNSLLLTLPNLSSNGALNLILTNEVGYSQSDLNNIKMTFLS